MAVSISNALLLDSPLSVNNQTLAEYDIQKAARMRLLGEDKIYTWEYERCLERIEARKRVAARREARRLSSNTKSRA